MPKTQEIYSDFRANLDAHPVKKDLVRLVNEAAVSRSIRNLLLTNKYERRNPDLGAGLAGYLFENPSIILESQIKTAIEFTIKNYEPRASLIEVQVSYRPDYNAYAATIFYSVINNAQPVKLDVLLQRVR